MRIDNRLKPVAIEKEIAYRTKEYRITYGITQKELADKAMVSLKTITRFENGEDIGLEKFIRILSAMDLGAKFDILVPDPTEHPSFYLTERKNKKRVRHKMKEQNNKNAWKWGDE